MNILVIGGGGREHALVWKLKQGEGVKDIYCVPGNAGIAAEATCFPVPPTDIDACLALAREKNIDLTVVGPEAPLVAGIVDAFAAAGFPIIGPDRAAAQLEGSKAFTKEILKEAGVPTADFETFDHPADALKALDGKSYPLVIKADGLAAGKGVLIVQDRKEAEDAIRTIMEEKAFGAAGDRVVLEEFLKGEEASFIVLTDGETILPLASSQDHKAIYDGDRGPNTGGMGAYSPAPVIDPAMHEKVMKTVIEPVIEKMNARGTPYRGILYAGLMIDDDTPYVLEFNVRMGDPETQPILFRMEGDLVETFMRLHEGQLHKARLSWNPGPSICVVLASGGYPGAYEKGKVIRGLETLEGKPDIKVFHAGTKHNDRGEIVTNGGRVLGVTAIDTTLAACRDKAYAAIESIHFEGMTFRKDIGLKGIRRTTTAA
ncbi:MAG: phosphoribosylamine--glycine ligase [Deltaproteobacteria bacterium]|nr:MAG: phosphoribosylamine--glycine ligase [Deltaproteobacteria bacterium]